jgi:hypothetical protein
VRIIKDRESEDEEEGEEEATTIFLSMGDFS